MESEQDKGPLLEEVLVHGPGCVKQGLVWLQSDKAKEFGLSLEQLVANVVHDKGSSEDFNLSMADNCAIGYAGTWTSYAQVHRHMGESWLKEHGFLIPSPEKAPEYADTDNYRNHRKDVHDAYDALTEEWRTQLQALAEEQRLRA